ncbi:hypothetical protein FKM82_025851 [Ascaphus truei]
MLRTSTLHPQSEQPAGEGFIIIARVLSLNCSLSPRTLHLYNQGGLGGRNPITRKAPVCVCVYYIIYYIYTLIIVCSHLKSFSLGNLAKKKKISNPGLQYLASDGDQYRQYHQAAFARLHPLASAQLLYGAGMWLVLTGASGR